ncbi:MAG: hypothetical protein RI972_1355 [Pseudomonadota bacterium]|jgi:FkbM family methyltransferase
MDLYACDYRLPMLGLTSSDAYVFNEIYGKEDAYQRARLLPLIKGGEVIEIGGHKGYFAMLAATVAKRAVVFEPNDHNFHYLCRNIELNGFHHVTPVKKAVSNTPDPREFTVSDKTDARHSLYETGFSGCARKIPVLCTTIADIVIDYSMFNISLLKIDCEGGEYDILFNLEPGIAEYIPRVVCEIHEAPAIPHKKADLVDHMKSLGYNAEVYSGRRMGDMDLWMAWFSR